MENKIIIQGKIPYTRVKRMSITEYRRHYMKQKAEGTFVKDTIKPMKVEHSVHKIRFD